MAKDNLLFLRRLHGRMDEWNKIGIKIWRQLAFPLGKKVYVLGTPEHTNVGDSAIVLAEIEFLKKCGVPEKRIKEITYNEYNNGKQWIKKFIRIKDLICWHGGGNLGDQWINEEYFRRNAMRNLEKNHMVIFPQTIYYTKTENGQREKRVSVKYYNSSTLTIVAREKKSYEIIHELYPKAKCLLTPDIVLSTNKEFFGIEKKKRKGVLVCLRNDAEKALSVDECKEIEDILLQMLGEFQCTDMYSDIPITKENRKECVQKKMQEFADAKLVVTDRLHGMIFSAIVGTPCIVFSNYNQKVSGTYEWIKDLPYICYIESVDEMKDAIQNLSPIEEGVFDNSKWMSNFNQLVEIVKKYII